MNTYSTDFCSFLQNLQMRHLSTQEPNLSHERPTQSTVAFLSFPGFYFPFKAGEGI